MLTVPPAHVVDSRLRALLALHLDLGESHLGENTRFVEDLGLDSLAAIELSMTVEDEFDVSLPDDVVAGVRTYGDLVAVVHERLGPPGTTG